MRRSSYILFLLLVLPLGAAAQTAAPGGHDLEIGLFGGYLDFDSEIRFENDIFRGLQASMGIAPWVRLGVELSQATVLDTRRSLWVSTLTASVRARFEPLTAHRLSPGAAVGVSFFAFEDDVRSDALSEGLDLGPSLRYDLSSRWTLRGDFILRLQTLRLTRVDPEAEALTLEETGYLWSKLFRVGLSHVF